VFLQALAEEQAGPVQAGLDRRNAQAHDFRHVLGREPFDIPEHQDHSGGTGKRRNAILERIPNLRRQHERFRVWARGAGR
jgi:hypothetical protein